MAKGNTNPVMDGVALLAIGLRNLHSTSYIGALQLILKAHLHISQKITEIYSCN
jgi:hypothetical protein